MAAIVEGAADTWSGILTDAVVRCGRDSERRLYLYGISSNRCAKCQARLRPGNDTCVGCSYMHKTPRKCTRCSQKNNPVMWCTECDAYFCAMCHKKPHVLMLGSTKPHHCFPVDGASGKYFVEAAWSEEFIAMTLATYRLRLSDKRKADEAVAKVPTQATKQLAPLAVNEASESTATTTTLLQQPQLPAEGSSATATVSDATGVLSASTSAAPPSLGSRPNKEEQSRKHQLLDSDDTLGRLQKSIRADESSDSIGRAPATPTSAPALIDGMTLYDRVKEMHDKRARATQPNAPQARSPRVSLNRLLSKKGEHKREQDEREKRGPDHVLQQQHQRELQRQQDQEQAEQSRNEQQRLDSLERLRTQKQQEEERWQKAAQEEQEKQRQQAEQRQQEEQRWQAEQRQQEEQRRQAMQQEKRKEGKRRHQEQLQQQLLEERMRHEQILRQHDEARSLMHKGNRFVSHAQYVVHAQPGYASMASSNISAPMPVASMAPLSVTALMPSNARFTQVPSPVNASPHASHFESAAPSSQNYQLPSNPGASAANAFLSMGNDHVYQEHTAVPVSRFEAISQDEVNCHLVVRDPSAQQQQQTDFPDAMVPHRIATGARGGFSPSKSGEDDELRAIWVSDYDNVNALVMQLDMEITKRTEEGRSFVHMSNNITIPEQLKLQLKNLRAQRDTATKKRFEALARVLIFSNTVRSFAQQHEHSNIWSDVPEVLKASHKKCAELAADIRVSERQAQKSREGIDEAVSSGDPAQMQNVVHLGALIADLERKIRISNGERDKQFIFMFQFSGTLRNMVRAEWAATGRGYHLQSSH